MYSASLGMYKYAFISNSTFSSCSLKALHNKYIFTFNNQFAKLPKILNYSGIITYYYGYKLSNSAIYIKIKVCLSTMQIYGFYFGTTKFGKLCIGILTEIRTTLENSAVLI